MKRYPVKSISRLDGTPSVILTAMQAALAPGAPFPHGLGDVSGYLYHTEEEIKAYPSLRLICEEPIEVP